MKNIVLTPNPYRDKNFQTVRHAVEILKAAGLNPRVCLPFDIDRSYELPRDIRLDECSTWGLKSHLRISTRICHSLMMSENLAWPPYQRVYYLCCTQLRIHSDTVAGSFH